MNPVPVNPVPVNPVPALAPPSAGSSRLRADQVTLGYGGHPVVEDLTLAVPDGEVTVIVGANACGKSTLLRGMARLLTPTRGAVLLDGQEVHRRPTREVARTLGLLPQQPVTPEGITVSELVGRGRHPHHGVFRRWSAQDDAVVAESLELTGTLDLADRDVDTLSGGQRQRVWVAMALAQQTDLLLLDEPTSFLDVAHQVELLDLLTDLNRERGTTVVMVLHELNLACRYAHRIVVMKEGAVVAEGAPRDVVTEELVADAFGLSSTVLTDPVSQTPLVVPVGRHFAGPDSSGPNSTAPQSSEQPLEAVR
jgi:iron complex transport system ATP-binding protein